MIGYQIKFHRENGLFWGEFPDLPGCFTQGETKKIFLQNAREALSLYLEEAQYPKWQLPVSKKRRGKNFIIVEPYPHIAIALLIKKARLQKGFTQRQLAQKLKMTTHQLQKLEKPGISNPTFKTLTKLSELLDFEVFIKQVA